MHPSTDDGTVLGIGQHASRLHPASAPDVGLAVPPGRSAWAIRLQRALPISTISGELVCGDLDGSPTPDGHGDEFAVLVDDLDNPEEATALAERRVAVLSRPYTVSDGDFSCPASIGVTFPLARQIDPEQIIHQADVAMYRTKRNGKAQQPSSRPLRGRSLRSPSRPR